MTGKIGFACKFLEEPRQINGFKPDDPAKKLNTGTTTVRWLNENASKKNDKLWDLVRWNLNSVEALVKRVASFPENQRMVRLSSDLLPVYTEPTHQSFYKSKTVMDFIQTKFSSIGEFAKQSNVKLSFHPGQYCVLASDRSDVVERSIEDFEYHSDMARWMGYGSDWHSHGFKINVHISGKNGSDGIIAVLPRLSSEARNLITIENEEMKWGLDDILKLKDHVALVLDTHHHWVNSGEYISADDSRVDMIVESWRGVRPTLHYSFPRETVIPNFDPELLPDMATLLTQGVKKAALRAHSDFYWNNAANSWVLGFLERFDIMCECKAKNLGSEQLARLI